MSEVQRYYVGKYGLVEGEALGRLSVVLAADFDRVTAENSALQSLLTAADERAGVLTKALSEAERVLGCYAPPTHNVLDLISAALKPAEGRVNEAI